MSKFLTMTAMMAAMFHHHEYLCDRRQRKDPLDGIDIEKEYELIKQKKSRLSARLRNMVVETYERVNNYD